MNEIILKFGKIKPSAHICDIAMSVAIKAMQEFQDRRTGFYHGWMLIKDGYEWFVYRTKTGKWVIVCDGEFHGFE